MRLGAWLPLLVALAAPAAGRAAQIEALESGREWRLRALRFAGNHAVKKGELREAMFGKPRAWYLFWRQRPEFDPVIFRADLDRLRRLYRSHGFYHARVDYDLELPAEGDLLKAVIYIEEGQPVRVEDVSVSLRDVPLGDKARTELLGHVPIARGQRFEEETYNRTYTYLRTYYREHGFARVHVTKKALVDLERDQASVAYTVRSGPPSVFGEVRISGTHRVHPDVARAEVAFQPGQPFKQSLLDRTRGNLTSLNLFRTIRIDEEKGRAAVVPIHIRLVEAPSHEIRLGAGYDTEEQIRGLAGWRDYNFLGGGRQLGFTARASFIRRTIAADFLQPHFPGVRDRVRLLLSEEQEDEEAYTNDRTRLSPRIEWQPVPSVTAYAFYRIEYDSLSGVSPEVRALLPDIAPHSGILSGLGFGADWNTTDDLLDPTRGWATSASVEPVGGFLGGKFAFLHLNGEGRFYQPLPARFGAALRFRLGAEEPLDGTRDIPLFERLYAGGINSVRGYERRHVGPLVNDDPVGGRSLVEGSAELRHPITEKLGAAVFIDAGQVSLRSFDFRFGDLRYGFGFGVRYKSPVGPLRVDLGIPLEPPDGDPHWQVHVSIGQAF